MKKALIIGVSEYPPEIGELKAVAADVREIGKILGSKSGVFPGKAVTILTDREATRSKALAEIQAIFRSAEAKDTVLVYMAGHGGIAPAAGSYHFLTHDANVDGLPATCVSLATVKQLFDECRSQRVFLWLDCCHSGGIIARRVGSSLNYESRAFARTLEVVSGNGKMIYARLHSRPTRLGKPKRSRHFHRSSARWTARCCCG